MASRGTIIIITILRVGFFLRTINKLIIIFNFRIYSISVLFINLY